MKKIALYSLVCFTLIGCGGGSSGTTENGGNTTPTGTQTTKTSQTFDASAMESSVKQAYLEAINNARIVQQDCGSEGIKPAVPILTWSNELYSAAAEHSKDLAAWNHGITTEEEAKKRFKHEGSGTSTDWTFVQKNLSQGSTTPERVNNSGYKWLRIGENITAGTNTDTAVDAVQSWLNSPPHCANLMNSDFTEVGMAFVLDPNSFYTYYWTQNFGKPR